MTLIAGKIITDGIRYAIVDAETTLLHSISYEKVKKSRVEFKYFRKNTISQHGFWSDILLFSDAYICYPTPSVEECRFVHAEDYLNFKSFNPGEPISRYTAGVVRERNGEYFVNCDIETAIKINPPECQALIDSQYVIIAVAEQFLQHIKEPVEYPVYMFPLTQALFQEYEAYKETEIDDLPPSLRF